MFFHQLYLFLQIHYYSETYPDIHTLIKENCYMAHPSIPECTPSTRHLPRAQQQYDWTNVSIGLRMGRRYRGIISGLPAIISMPDWISPYQPNGAERIEVSINGNPPEEFFLPENEHEHTWLWDNWDQEVDTFTCRGKERRQACWLISCECHRKAFANYQRAGRIVGHVNDIDPDTTF